MSSTSRTILVHATPAGALAEMDARNRATTAWLSDAALDVAAAAAITDLDSGDPMPLPDEPGPTMPPFPEEVPPVNPIGIPQPSPDVIDPVPSSSPGLPGGPPEVPKAV